MCPASAPASARTIPTVVSRDFLTNPASRGAVTGVAGAGNTRSANPAERLAAVTAPAGWCRPRRSSARSSPVPDRIGVDGAGAVDRNRPGGAEKHHAAFDSIPSRWEEVDPGIDSDASVVRYPLQKVSGSCWWKVT